MDGYELELKRFEIESYEKWRDWCTKMPKLHFKEEWEVKIIPPFGGAFARFTIDYKGNHISVYCDVLSRLGYMVDDNGEPIPYFEIYPNENGDCSRYYFDEVDAMMHEIDRLLKKGAE